MILSQQFSRQNKAHQTLPNGYAASSPTNGSSQHKHQYTNGFSTVGRKPPASKQHKQSEAYKSNTLNRLDLLRHRRELQQRCNGVYGETKRSVSLVRDPPNNTISQNRPNERFTSNGYKSRQAVVQSDPNNNIIASNYKNKPSSTAIYTPASIASPREYYGRSTVRPNVGNDESQHYASTSCGHYQPSSTSQMISSAAMSESGRSNGRPESALGHLWERIGTLRKRMQRTKSTKSKSIYGATGLPPSNGYGKSNGFVYGAPDNIQLANGGLSTKSRLPNSSVPAPNEHKVIDPEIYAKGKKEVGAEEIYAEGLQAIDGNTRRRLLEHNINESIMSEGEVVTLIDQSSKEQRNYQELVATLTNWINDELAQQRIIVTDLQEDLHDGQILGRLIEKLQKIQLDVVEVTQNEINQRLKLRTVLDAINRTLASQARWARIRWSVDGILSKNIIEIIHLLITLAIYYRVPIRVPPNVTVNATSIQKSQGRLIERSQQVKLTGDISNLSDGPNGQFAQQRPKDAFDTLIEYAPDKLAMVKQTLVRFVNRHLNKINMSCFTNRVTDVLDPEQFSDGLLLVFLIASLEDYFVPLGTLFTAPVEMEKSGSSPSNQLTTTVNEATPATQDGLITALEPENYINSQPLHKLHNVNVALQLIEDSGIEIKKHVRAEDIVNGDLKSLLRVLYTLFSRYKHI